MNASPRRRPATAVAVAWSCGAAALLLVRLRAEWPPWVDLHRWLASAGVPDWLRAQDGLLLQLLAAGLGGWLAGRCVAASTRQVLWLGAGRGGAWPVVGLAALPMLVAGFALGLQRGSLPGGLAATSLWNGVVRAPLVEELLCRGLLVGVAAAALGPRAAATRACMLLGALLFAALHVPWTAAGFAAGWPTLLVTAAGGVWFAWLLLRWQSLWVPIALHAAMNLGWLLGQTRGGAGGGGLVENAARAATIALATWLTIRRTRPAAA